MSEMLGPDTELEESQAPEGYYTDLHTIELRPVDIDLITAAMGAMTGIIEIELHDKGVENYERLMMLFLGLSEKIR